MARPKGSKNVRDVSRGTREEKQTQDESVPITGSSRRLFLKENLKEIISNFCKEYNRSFNFYKIVEMGKTRGLLRDHLRKNGDNLTDQDLYIIRDLMQEFKQEKFLLHKGGKFWALVDPED